MGTQEATSSVDALAFSTLKISLNSLFSGGMALALDEPSLKQIFKK